MEYEDGDYYNGSLGQRTAVWLQAKVRDGALGLRPRLNPGPVTHSVAEASYATCGAM